MHLLSGVRLMDRARTVPRDTTPCLVTISPPLTSPTINNNTRSPSRLALSQSHIYVFQLILLQLPHFGPDSRPAFTASSKHIYQPPTLSGKMRSVFKDEHPYEKRKGTYGLSVIILDANMKTAEAERIRQKYTDRIPVCHPPPRTATAPRSLRYQVR